MSRSRLAVLRPEDYPKNAIEGLDWQNLNFWKLIYIISDSLFGGSVYDLTEGIRLNKHTLLTQQDRAGSIGYIHASNTLNSGTISPSKVFGNANLANFLTANCNYA